MYNRIKKPLLLKLSLVVVIPQTAPSSFNYSIMKFSTQTPSMTPRTATTIFFTTTDCGGSVALVTDHQSSQIVFRFSS